MESTTAVLAGSSRSLRRGALLRYRISIRGVVQGVGFRPFVKRTADALAVTGVVYNTTDGVVIDVEARAPLIVDRLLARMSDTLPPAARIESVEMERDLEPRNYTGFEIVRSRHSLGHRVLPVPDLACCEACREEIRDPQARRHGYPFTNCTNCGPRYTITGAVPYDRPNTTMAAFSMCAPCASEYRDVGDRRFHAQPIACPECGPRLWLEPAAEAEPLEHAREILRRGGIVALKSLGGFQLACNGLNAEAIDRLRDRKRRSRKPFAVMMRDRATVERYCRLDSAERALLESTAAPIVLLRLRPDAALPASLAPGLEEIGVMLPYTPLHHLLLDGLLSDQDLPVLVMTSGNLSEEPIVISNAEARRRLTPLADSLLLHNRDIFTRVDDAVTRVVEGRPMLLRRARGFTPQAIPLNFCDGEILGCGAELKNTFCIGKGGQAILSQHIGDMENIETLGFFEETLDHLKRVYQADPHVIAHDLHPNYLTSRWALAQGHPAVAVQHHHAHIAACMAENQIDGPVLGVAMDGTGYGEDGMVWGGEFLVCDFQGFRRSAHLRYVPLLGGDRAARETFRMAASVLIDAYKEDWRKLNLPLWNVAPANTWTLLERMAIKPPIKTSSCGRLFDAVASLTGICQANGYEGEAAMLVEAAARSCAPVRRATYPYAIQIQGDTWEIDTRPLIRALTRDVLDGCSSGEIARVFHESLGRIIEEICCLQRRATGLDAVCLSGGVFQNATLSTRVIERLRGQHFHVFTHSLVPPNDGGIALGQVAVAAARARGGNTEPCA